MIEISDDDINQVESLLEVEFDEIRRQAIKSFDDIQACPGSGKTTMVAAKLLIIARKWKLNHQGVCVLTHTNVAKKEIIDRLKQSSYGERLLSHPHFIGTIQEFVNKFLAIPYLRSSGLHINTIDDEVCNKKGWHLLKWKTKSYLERNRITSLQGMEYKLINGELKHDVPGFKKTSTSDSYQDLIRTKQKLIQKGYFFYGEMYAFAKHYLLCNPEIINAVRSRFPIVLVDEMQDTQKFQDELLNDIFQNKNVKLQRFGDPDQAIYSGEAEENQTYNHQVLEKIENTHRFDNSIALLSKKLSVNQINLSSNIEIPDETSHTIFLVDDDSRNNVFLQFAELCAKAIPSDCTKPIKTVGAIGLRKDDGLTISHYLDSYDKGYSTASFKPSKLIHYFYESKKLESNYEAYRLIIEGITKSGQISNSELEFSDGSKSWYSPSSIRKYLKDSAKQVNFNQIIRSLILTDIDKPNWEQSINSIVGIFSLNDTDFLNFDDTTERIDNTINPNEVVCEINGRVIKNEVATIHSVKGETHAATLVLETKHHEFDISKLIDYILGENTTKPTGVRKPKFMKQLYVAFSRPKHLLCVAMDKSRFPQAHINKDNYAGWKIVDLTL